MNKAVSTVLALGLVLAIFAGAASASMALGTGTGALRHDGVTYFDMTDPENNGAANANTNYNAVFTSTNEPGFGGGEFSFNVFDNRVGGGSDKWCCDDPGSAGHQLTAQFLVPITLTSFTITSSNDSTGRDPTDWSIQGSNDGVSFTPIYTNPGASVWGTRNQVVLFEAGGVDYATPAAYKFIQYDVQDTVSGGHALNELEYFDSSRTTMPPPPTPVAQLTGVVGADVAGRAYGDSAGTAYPPTSWTLEETGTPTMQPGFRETIWDGALPDGDVTGNIENVRAAAAGPLGANDAQGILTGRLHYQDDNAVSTRAAALGAVGFNNGNFTMLWETTFTPDENGDWGFRNNNVDDRYSFWIDLDQDGVLESDERFFERGGCCAGSGDRLISQATSPIDALVAGQEYLLGLVMNDTGGGGYFRDMEFKSPTGAWTDVNPSAAGQEDLWTVIATPWTTLATGTNQVGDVGSDGLFGVSLPEGDHHLRLTVEASGQTTTAEGDFTVIPEPATMALLGLAVTGLAGYVRRRRRA